MITNKADEKVSTEMTEKFLQSHEEWSRKLTELREYQKKHGSCKVRDRTNPGLRSWLDQQLEAHRCFQLVKDREIALLELGVEELSTRGSDQLLCDQKEEREIRWNRAFEDLIDFKGQYGHTNVSRYTMGREFLGIWVKRQRRLMKQKQLRPDRLKRLLEIGCEPSCRKRPRTNRSKNGPGMSVAPATGGPKLKHHAHEEGVNHGTKRQRSTVFALKTMESRPKQQKVDKDGVFRRTRGANVVVEPSSPIVMDQTKDCKAQAKPKAKPTQQETIETSSIATSNRFANSSSRTDLKSNQDDKDDGSHANKNDGVYRRTRAGRSDPKVVTALTTTLEEGDNKTRQATISSPTSTINPQFGERTRVPSSAAKPISHREADDNESSSSTKGGQHQRRVQPSRRTKASSSAYSMIYEHEESESFDEECSLQGSSEEENEATHDKKRKRGTSGEFRDNNDTESPKAKKSKKSRAVTSRTFSMSPSISRKTILVKNHRQMFRQSKEHDQVIPETAEPRELLLGWLKTLHNPKLRSRPKHRLVGAKLIKVR